MTQEPTIIEGISPHEEIRLSNENEGIVLIEIDEPYSNRPKGYARVELTRDKAHRLINWLGRFVAGEGM
jgi:hypothetical protein